MYSELQFAVSDKEQEGRAWLSLLRLKPRLSPFLTGDALTDGVFQGGSQMKVNNLKRKTKSSTFEWRRMKYMKNLSFFFLLSLVVLQLGQAQDKRLRRDDLSVQVKVKVTQLDSGYFRYQFTVENSTFSHQSLVGFFIDLNDEWTEYGGTVRNVLAPSEKDWGTYPTVGKQMRWVTYYDTTGLDALEWMPLSAIQAGEHLSFSFESKGLPTLGHFWAEGWAPWYFTEQQRDSLLLEGYPESDLQLRDENFLKGTTVVRGAPSATLLPIQFLDTLNSYISQSCSLGWIKDQSTATKYLSYFESAKTGLQHNHVEPVCTTLKQVLHEVNVDSLSNLTSEAYALIRYNTEYLLRQLPVAPGNEKR